MIRLAFAALCLSGCYQTTRLDDPDGAPLPWDAAGFDAGSDGGPGPDGGRPDTGVPKCVQPAGVDLLLLVDNSNSMSEEQASLAAGLPTFLSVLLSPPDVDPLDGEPDWLPVTDLRVGVITTDMGTGDFAVPTCANSRFGDDGILRTAGNTDLGCAATYPSFVTYQPFEGNPAAFVADVSCVAQAGVGGCGFEQPLEAVLKALSPRAATSYTGPGYVSPTFFLGTRGHGLDANAGFVRDDTLLAIVVLTDEEDCSTRDPDIYNPASSQYPGDLNLRCFNYPAAVHPVQRYVDGLLALRQARPDLLSFSVIAGVPSDLSVGRPSAADFEAILADPRMQEQIDPGMPNRLLPSCNVAGRGLAFPPRRLVEVAAGLGPTRSSIHSICNDDLGRAAEEIAELVGHRACGRFQ